MNARIEKYLKAYNLVQLAGWLLALVSLPFSFMLSFYTVCFVQLLSLLEIFHAYKKWNNSSPLLCFVQIAARLFILLIFTLNSMIIGLFASIIGGIIGIYYANNLESIIDGLSEVINTFGRGLSKSGEWRDVKLVPKDIYYFDHLPVDIDISFIFMVTTAATILSGLAGYFPARWAANLDPVETIKND